LAGDEVEVIGHHVVAEDVHGEATEAALEEAHKILIVHHFRKQAPPVIAAVRDMGWDSNRQMPPATRHGHNLQTR
jgi:hypothetical protein